MTSYNMNALCDYLENLFRAKKEEEFAEIITRNGEDLNVKLNKLFPVSSLVINIEICDKRQNIPAGW